MTRIVAGQDLIHRTELTYTPDRIWWGIQAPGVIPFFPYIVTSDLIPDGTVVHELQIQARGNSDWPVAQFDLYISIVQSKLPTDIEIQEAPRLIPWLWNERVFMWQGIMQDVNESWPMRKTLHGAQLRFAVAIISGDPNGIECRVSILYSPG